MPRMFSLAATPVIGCSNKIALGLLLSNPTTSFSRAPTLGKLTPTSNSAFAEILASAKTPAAHAIKTYFTNRGDKLALINLLHLGLAIRAWLGFFDFSSTLDSHLLIASFFFAFSVARIVRHG